MTEIEKQIIIIFVFIIGGISSVGITIIFWNCFTREND